jgi:hypothetical protein
MMTRISRFGHDRGIAMFADSNDRIAAGELPPAGSGHRAKCGPLHLGFRIRSRHRAHDVISTDIAHGGQIQMMDQSGVDFAVFSLTPPPGASHTLSADTTFDIAGATNNYVAVSFPAGGAESIPI